MDKPSCDLAVALRIITMQSFYGATVAGLTAVGSGFGTTARADRRRDVGIPSTIQIILYMVSMDIPMIGRTKSRILDTVFSGNLTAFEQAAVGDYDFTQLEDFGEILNHNIHSWFADEANLDLWKNLQNEFTFEQRKEETIMTKENKFTGCTIVATGKLEHFTRDGINDKILELGAKPGSSVTKKTDYQICGEKAGSKLAKAQSLGIPILTEAEFLEMIA